MFSSLRSAWLRVGFTGLLLTHALLAAFPSKPGEDTWINRPNDPGYGGMWNLFSHLPPNHTGLISAFEKLIGSGVHADKAWQWHIGTPETVVAVLDSGIFWNHSDLLDRFYLNRGELPLPEGSSQYDANNDGRFSVKDYEGDSRVRDKNGNGVVDPGDLIAIFSNGVDEDQSGYIDDISGWDFHELDNDASDRTGFGHGTGEAIDSTAALNNGIGGAGICGNCSIMPIRLNDSFIVDANAFAQGVIFATDQKVSLIQQALGSVNHSPYVRAAIEYAFSNGVPIIGSAADENSFHHNYPSTIDPVIYANAIRFDTQRVEDATTFLNFNNCSNYGARVDVSVPGKACSSEATGILSGVASLTLSYARSLGKSLAPLELNGLIKASATDINLGPADKDSDRHSTYEGWDTITGYGRANNHDMIKAIHEDRIPPIARILSPHWFELFLSKRTRDIAVSIEVAAPRSSSYRVQLEILKGVESAQTKALVIKTSELRSAFSGEFARISLAQIQGLVGGPLDAERNKYAYTLRLKVTDTRGLASEARRTVFVFEDPLLVKGFPKKLVGSGESSGFFMDLDGDGGQDFITGDGAGFVHAFKKDGSELPGFPAATALSRYRGKEKGAVYASIVAATAGADLDGDGSPEIVAASFEGHLSVVGRDGKMRSGFPIELPLVDKNQVHGGQTLANGILAAPVLVDLDSDGKLEIVVAGFDGQLHAYRHDGSKQKGFPVAVLREGNRAKLVSSPAVVDINKDKIPDLVLGSNHQGANAGFLFAIDGRGHLAPSLHLKGFPVKIPIIRDALLPTIGVGIPTSPSVGDIDGDGEQEIIIHPFVGKTYVVSLNGQLKRSMSMRLPKGHTTNDTHMVSAFGHPALGDVNGDGSLDPVTVGAGKRMLVNLLLGGKRYDVQHFVSAWDGTSGKMFSSYPKQLEDTLLSPSPVVVDLNGDKKSELIVGSGGYFVHAFTESGEISGFPHFTGGWMYGAPAVGDIDGDGTLEVAVTTREGYAFVWETKGHVNALKNGWAAYKANRKRTGNLKGN